jgi:hypothetical protein
MGIAIITSQNHSAPIEFGQTFPLLNIQWTGVYHGSYEIYKNGVLQPPYVNGPTWLVVGANTSPPAPPLRMVGITKNIGAVAEDAGTYVVRLYNSAPDTGYVDAEPIILTMMTPILDRIEKKISSLVAGMRKVDGYNFDWAMVNEQDSAMPDSGGNISFPQCIVDPSDSIADKEINQDTLAGVGSLDYTNEVIFTLLVKGELPVFETNPLFAIRSTLRKAQDDLKKLFGIHLNLDSECDNIMYSGSQIESLLTNDVQRPARLRTFWKVVYSQDRQTPTRYASS